MATESQPQPQIRPFGKPHWTGRLLALPISFLLLWGVLWAAAIFLLRTKYRQRGFIWIIEDLYEIICVWAKLWCNWPISTYGWKGSTAARTSLPVLGTSDRLMSRRRCRGSSQRSSRFRQLTTSYWKPVCCHSSIPSVLSTTQKQDFQRVPCYY